jgi:hypothetical protein
MAMAVGLLCVLPLGYLVITRSGGHMSGQLVVTQWVGLGLLSLVALALLGTVAVSVLRIRDSRAFTGGQARAAAGRYHGR